MHFPATNNCLKNVSYRNRYTIKYYDFKYAYDVAENSEELLSERYTHECGMQAPVHRWRKCIANDNDVS